jgi:hypothetical protein
MATKNPAFEQLKAEINKVPELKDNKALSSALDNAQKEIDKDPKASDSVSDIFSELGKAIPKFTYKDSNQYDIISGIFDVTNAVIKVFGLIPGAKVITGPLGAAVGVLGAIFGGLGTSKTTKYFNALTAMVNDAVEKLNDELTNQSLSGAINVLQADHNMLAGILSVEHADLKKLAANNPTYNAHYFALLAESKLGSAIDYLKSSTGKSNANNWSLAADTYHKTLEVVAYKLLCLLEATAYFNLIEGGDTDTDSATYELNKAMNDFMDKYKGEMEPFFVKPTITNSALTQYMYRFTEAKFNFVILVNHFLSRNTDSYFPDKASQYRFNCHATQQHSHPENQMDCVKLTTLRALHDGKGLRINSSIPSSGAYIYFKKNESKYDYLTHFNIYTIEGAKPPFKKWILRTRNECKDLSNSYKPISYPYELTAFIFEVFPTAEELNNSSRWPNKWKFDPNGKTLLIIGCYDDKNNNTVVGDHNGSDLKNESFHEFVYEKKHYGSPDHCIWVMLNENE